MIRTCFLWVLAFSSILNVAAGPECSARALQSTCDVQSACEWWGANSSCINKICPYATRSTCNAAPTRCYWNATTSVCSRVCAEHGTQSGCSASFSQGGQQCQWSTIDNTCHEPCGERYYGASACVSDINCVWDYSKTLCEPACASHMSQGKCPSATCLWLQISNKCIQSCSSVYSDSHFNHYCPQDPLCQVYTSGLCGNKCSLVKYAEDCNLDGFNGDGQECQWNVMSHQCDVNCDNKFVTQSLCNADQSCMWVASANGCRASCSVLELGTKSQCEGAVFHSQKHACIWYDEGCHTSCGVRYQVESTCKADTDCYWDPSAATCVQTCPTRRGESTCTGDCYWADNQCNWHCDKEFPHLGSRVDCSLNSGCQWNYTDHRTARTCTGKTQPLCEASPSQNCRWFNGTCERPCEETPTTESCASRSSFCFFNSVSGCHEKCSNMGSKESCSNSEQCDWLSTVEVCATSCRLNTIQSSCSATPGCTWTTSKDCKRIVVTPAPHTTLAPATTTGTNLEFTATLIKLKTLHDLEAKLKAMFPNSTVVALRTGMTSLGEEVVAFEFSGSNAATTAQLLVARKQELSGIVELSTLSSVSVNGTPTPTPTPTPGEAPPSSGIGIGVLLGVAAGAVLVGVLMGACIQTCLCRGTRIPESDPSLPQYGTLQQDSRADIAEKL